LEQVLAKCRRVDVFHIETGTGGTVMKPIVRGVLAIAPDNLCLLGVPPDAPRRVYICLALTAEEAVRVILASKKGEIRILLANHVPRK
jgi:hypothetical protein